MKAARIALQQDSAAPLIPDGATIDELRGVAAGCTACPLWAGARQTVFGEGPETARLVLVGEQPGDEEDLAGRPFVGPAGRLLRRALADAGIDEGAVYVTNAVKHFKWVAKGKKRIHSKPSGREIRACKPWLDAELEALEAEVIVALGATAAQALLGPSFKITQHLGEVLPFERESVVVPALHPSAVLRSPDEEARRANYGGLVRALQVAASTAASP